MLHSPKSVFLTLLEGRSYVLIIFTNSILLAMNLLSHSNWPPGSVSLRTLIDSVFHHKV